MMDIFKQGMGQLLLHFLNIFLAIFITKGHSTVDQCTMYFTVFILDLFPGLPITIALSLLSDFMFRKCGCRNLVSGNYVYDNLGDLGIRKCVYVIQILIWSTIIFLSKCCTTFIGYFVQHPLEIFSRFILKIVSFNNVSTAFLILREQNSRNYLQTQSITSEISILSNIQNSV